VISLGSCDACVLDHLDITSSPAYESFEGILNDATSRDLRITNDRIHHIGQNGRYDHGIYCASPTPGGVVEGNWLYRNAAYGAQFYPNCDGIDFRYNVVANNGALADCGSLPHGRHCPASTTNGLGVALSGDGGGRATDGALIRSSIIYSGGRTDEPPLHCYDPGSGNSVRSVVLYWSSGSASGSDCPGSVAMADVRRKVNPGFVDQAHDDYRLRSDSPARSLMGSFADRAPGPRL
jgi:hypothetical protein